MGRIVVRLIVTAIALFAAVWLVPGVDLLGATPEGIPPLGTLINLLIVAVIFGLVNAIVRPILKVLTCAINFFTFGLFIFVINALMLLLTAAISQRLNLGFSVTGFIPALLGSIVVSVVSIVLSILVPDDD